MTAQDDRPAGNQDAQKEVVNRRLDAIGWGLFFIMLGSLWLIPEERLPGDSWLSTAAIGVGLILLGVNAARSLYGIKASGGAIVVGILAIVYGVTGVYGVDLPFFAIAFIVIGAVIILFPRKGSWRCGRD